MADNFDTNNPPRTVKFTSFPNYDTELDAYKPEAIEAKFFAESDPQQSVDDFLKPYAKNDEDLKNKKELFYKLYVIGEEEKANPSNEKFSTKMVVSDNNSELALAVRYKDEALGDYGFVIRDGKITFSSANLSTDQIKEAYNFLYMRGLASSLDIPENLATNLKDGLETAKAELGEHNADENTEYRFALENENGEEVTEPLTGQEFSQWYHENYKTEQNSENAPIVAAPKKPFGMKEAIAEVDEWGDAQGEVRGLNFFHLRESGGWHVWAAYKDLNVNNVYDEVKKDKDGNIRAQFRHKVYARMKNGRLEVGYAVPPGEKLNSDPAEMMTKLASKSGYNAIRFHGVQEQDYYTIRKACAKELIVPINISLKPDGCLNMIQDARGYHPQGRKVAQYERFLVEQIKRNAEKSNREMNDSEAKLYEDVYIRSNLANFRSLYASTLKGKLDDFAKDGGSAVGAIAASNLIADFYTAYRDGVVSGVNSKGKSYVPTLEDIFTSSVKENDKDGKLITRPLFTAKEIKQFKDKFPTVDISELKMPNLDPVHMEEIYQILIPKYEKLASELLDDTYINGSVTDNPQKVASNALRNVYGKLSEDVSKDFSGNVNLDGIKPLNNHGIVLPAIGNISNPYYKPSEKIEEQRKKNIAKRNQGLKNPMLNDGR